MIIEIEGQKAETFGDHWMFVDGEDQWCCPDFESVCLSFVRTSDVGWAAELIRYLSEAKAQAVQAVDEIREYEDYEIDTDQLESGGYRFLFNGFNWELDFWEDGHETHLHCSPSLHSIFAHAIEDHLQRNEGTFIAPAACQVITEWAYRFKRNLRVVRAPAEPLSPEVAAQVEAKAVELTNRPCTGAGV